MDHFFPKKLPNSTYFTPKTPFRSSSQINRKSLHLSVISICLSAIAKIRAGDYESNTNSQKYPRATVAVVLGLGFGIIWEIVDSLILNFRWKISSKNIQGNSGNKCTWALVFSLYASRYWRSSSGMCTDTSISGTEWNFWLNCKGIRKMDAVPNCIQFWSSLM